MRPVVITAKEAAPFFAHHSQQIDGVAYDPPESMAYLACGGVCLAFHPALWPGVYMVHLGAMPSAWGRVDKPADAILRAAWADLSPARIIAWVKESNRLTVALCKRLGFELDGQLPLAAPVLCYGWRP